MRALPARLRGRDRDRGAPATGSTSVSTAGTCAWTSRSIVGQRSARTAGREPAGVPLLLVNGIGASLELLQPFVDELDPALGGHPLRRSRGRRFAAARPAVPFHRPVPPDGAAAVGLGYGQADVLGISWGGGVAQHFALFQRRRCRRLVLVSTATGSLMVPARPGVLARMVTPRRYLDRGYMRRRRRAPLRRFRAQRAGPGQRADARREPGRRAAGLPVPARGRRRAGRACRSCR